jgi:NodT family efflux transporter outer membrane factor (OMF) lipoprotein
VAAHLANAVIHHGGHDHRFAFLSQYVGLNMKRIGCIVTIAIAGCTSEPVRPPAIPTAEQYTSSAVADQSSLAVAIQGGGAQSFVSGQDIPAEWWHLFQSPALDGLVRQALDNSPTLAQANAKLRQVQSDKDSRAGAQWPKVDAKVSANRIDLDSNALGQALPLSPPLDLYLASVGVSYNLDIFGATRHELRGLQAQVDYQRYELEAARLSLAGNVVTAAIREASLREQIATVEEIIALQTNRLTIVEKLEQLGTAAHGDVVAQRLDLAQTRVQLPELQRQLEQVRHRLAVYIGQAPGTAQLPEFHLAELQLPAQLPLSLPSELARQRPDIRAAEAMLHQAGEQVGVATAHLYPQITLSATVGSIATHSGDLLSGDNLFSLLGASLTQPIFHGRELQAKRRSAVATYEQAGAAYKEVVLNGLQNVADVLRALEADAQKVHDRAEAAEQARSYQEIVVARYKAGGVSYYTLLDAERRLHAAQLDRTQAVADRYANSAALLQALGGGWWKEEQPTK